MPDHAQHDALLVAQLAAGDALEAGQQAQAAWLVANCGACAQLAADLRAVSGAVAWEPVPRRHRDLRISPEQAVRARGGVLDRFVRRLAMPQSSTLRPAAAGVMSLGLLFVVAGAVWPFDDSPIPVPTMESQSTPPRERAPAPDVVQLQDDGLGGVTDAAGAVLAPSGPPEQAEMAASQKALVTEDIAADRLAAQDDTSAADAEELAAGASELFAVEAGAQEPDVAARGETPDAVADITASAAPAASEAALPGAVDGSDLVIVEPGANSPDAGFTTEMVLLALGVVLAAGGALVLLLVWLARRVGDPLLR